MGDGRAVGVAVGAGLVANALVGVGDAADSVATGWPDEHAVISAAMTAATSFLTRESLERGPR